MDISSNIRQTFEFPSNIRRMFVEFASSFRHMSVKYLYNVRQIFDFLSNIRQVFVKCRPNVVNLGPWANELEDKWIQYT